MFRAKFSVCIRFCCVAGPRVSRRSTQTPMHPMIDRHVKLYIPYKKNTPIYPPPPYTKSSRSSANQLDIQPFSVQSCIFPVNRERHLIACIGPMPQALLPSRQGVQQALEPLVEGPVAQAYMYYFNSSSICWPCSSTMVQLHVHVAGPLAMIRPLNLYPTLCIPDLVIYSLIYV